MTSIIKEKKSVIPACDVATLEELEALVKAVDSVKGIGAYKIGFSLALPYGLPAVVKIIRKQSKKPIIYDHQKAGTDIPDTGAQFAAACASARVDAVILFPQAGPETLKAWVKHCAGEGLRVIVGGEMTHPAFLASDGGFLTDDAPRKIYELAASLGVTDFVVPGNKPGRVEEYRAFLEWLGIKPVFYSPGFIAQGGVLSEAARVAGENWHAIVGRALYGAGSGDAAARAAAMRAAAEKLCAKLFG
ncbi:MAG: orotidine 5'-phosphate decarboxylase / HUMPS family protein [Candidatus Norongarragalinales archaeon]